MTDKTAASPVPEPRRWWAGLSLRLVLSHLAVAVIGGLSTYLVVRWLAPAIFDHSIAQGTGVPGAGHGPQAGMGLRAQVSAAVNQALLIGTGVGLAVALIAGVLIARRLSKSVRQLRAATRRIASGNYQAAVPRASITELSELSSDVAELGSTLASTEARRVRLLGEVAHEMRTPLTVIDGYVEAMIDQVLPAGPTELGQVSAEVRRLRRLAEDLSLLSRAEEQRLRIDLTPGDLGQVVNDAVQRLVPQADDAAIRLSVSVPPLPLRATFDADRIAQVVTNVVGNALRATPAGGSVQVVAQRIDDRAVITVTDTGEGLAGDDLERIFDRFYRVGGRRTNPSADTGSGIGLTISRRIMQAHAGHLVAFSQGPGTGSRFTIELPARDSRPRDDA